MSRRNWAFDIALAAVVGVLGQLEVWLGIGSTHRQGPLWVQSLLYAVTALLLVAVAHVWMFTGYTCAIFLAGYANIPADLEEAARLDGANGWQRFCRIQLPLLAPSFTVNIMLSTIGTMKAFELPFVMTKGGPDGATQTVGLQIIQTLFQEYRFGLASALSIVLLIVVLLIAFVQNRVLRLREDML